MGTALEGYGKEQLRSMSLGLVKYDEKKKKFMGGWEGEGKATDNMASSFKQGLLGALTASTSQLKTGAGEYGDETLADSMFPKTINNMMSDDRENARKTTDAKTKADAIADTPGPAPDMADKLLKRAGADSLLRGKAKQGRRSAFLGG